MKDSTIVSFFALDVRVLSMIWVQMVQGLLLSNSTLLVPTNFTWHWHNYVVQNKQDHNTVCRLRTTNTTQHCTPMVDNTLYVLYFIRLCHVTVLLQIYWLTLDMKKYENNCHSYTYSRKMAKSFHRNRGYIYATQL